MHVLLLGLTAVSQLLIGLTYAVIVLINTYDRSVFWLLPEQIHICNLILTNSVGPDSNRPAAWCPAGGDQVGQVDYMNSASIRPKALQPAWGGRFCSMSFAEEERNIPC